MSEDNYPDPYKDCRPLEPDNDKRIIANFMEPIRQCLYCQNKQWVTRKDRISCCDPPAEEPEHIPSANVVGLWNWPDEFHYSCKTGDCQNFKQTVTE